MKHAVAVGVVAVSGVAVANIQIDDFSTLLSAETTLVADNSVIGSGQIGVLLPTVINMQTASFEASPAGAIGDRSSVVNLDPNASNVQLQIGNGLLGFSNGSSETDSDFEITYNNFSSDFSTLPNGAIEFEVNSSDLDNRNPAVFLPVTIGVNGVERSVDVSGEGVYQIEFGAYAGVDFSNVIEITFAFDTQSIVGVDISFTNFRAVPTPGAVVVLGMAGVVAGRRRR